MGPTYPWAEAEVQSCSGFGLGYSKSDESSQSCHTQGHASNNGHAHQSIWREEKGHCQSGVQLQPARTLATTFSLPTPQEMESQAKGLQGSDKSGFWGFEQELLGRGSFKERPEGPGIGVGRELNWG